MDSQPIDDNSLMNIELDYYNRLFNNRLCPSPKEVEGRDRRDYAFTHMWELFVYAAILGFNESERKPVLKAYKPFRWYNIGNVHQKNLLIMAVTTFNSFEILQDKDELKKLIEEYANGGLAIIDRELKNNPSSYSDLESFTFNVLGNLRVQ
jgi:dnd system-associated protein 4